MALVIMSVIGIIWFGKQIKFEHRIELAFEIGIFVILFGIFSSLILPRQFITNPFIYSPLWILFGFVCLIIGYELLGEINKEKIFDIKKYCCIGLGSFILFIFLSPFFANDTKNQSLIDNYLLIGFWLILGSYLISVRFIKKPHNFKMIESIQVSLPIGLGLLFILFGVYLFNLNKSFEGLIEIVIGIIIMKYSFSNKFYSKDSKELLLKIIFPIFLICTEILTFYIIIYN
jgi:hypothetical protein